LLRVAIAANVANVALARQDADSIFLDLT
jgi:hypothetical protein